MKKILAVLAVVLFFCAVRSVSAADPVVAAGKLVKLEYTLTVNNEVVETSVGKDPLQFIAGEKTIIPGLENGLLGLHAGEEKVITIEPKDAYGEVDAKAFKEFPKSTMPKEAEPKVGMVLQAQAPDGESFPAVISEIKGENVVLDFNHPLAGKQLSFKVKVLDITDAPAMPAAAAEAAPAAK